jgi:hypothetical protein
MSEYTTNPLVAPRGEAFRVGDRVRFVADEDQFANLGLPHDFTLLFDEVGLVTRVDVDLDDHDPDPLDYEVAFSARQEPAHVVPIWVSARAIRKED